MIQRKQTLFLLFAVIAIAICLFLPIASIAAKTMGGDTMVYNLGVVGGGRNADFNYLRSSVPSARRFSHHSIGKHLFVQESEASEITLFTCHAFCRFMVCRLYRDVHGLDSCS